MDLKDKIVICNGKIRPEWLQEADALYSTGNIRIDETLLQKAPKLRVVAQASVGYDNIDVEACNARNVKIGNTPGVLVNAVADIAYGLLIDTARNIVRGHLHTKNGLWGERKALGLGVDLYNKTLGIVGFGDIGSAIAKRAQLLQTSDFIVVAVTLNPSTRGMFDEAAFAAMKDGVRFVNISRGKVVDTDALYNAVKSGKVAAAGLDVTEPEPLPGDHPLTRDEMALVTAQNIIAALSGQPMLAQVK